MFADEYIITGNIYKSAIKAGYSENYSKGNASKLLEKESIKSYIAQRMQQIDEDTIMKQEEVLKLLTKQARRQETDYQVTQSEQPIYDDDGLFVGMQRVAETVEVPTQNKDAIKALELIGKRYGLWTDKQEITGSVAVQIVDDVPSDADD